jgi:hypothetical protein
MIGAIAVALCHPAGAAQREQNTRPVRLTFAWADGMRVAVHMSFTQRYAEEPAIVAQLRTTLVVSRQGPNLRLSFIDSTVTADVSGKLERYGQTLEELRFLSVPDFLVSRQGKFVGLAPDQHIQSVLEGAFGNTRGLTPDRIDELVNRFGEGRARVLWSEWVLFWIGATMYPQTVYEMKRKVATILPAGPLLPVSSNFQVVRQQGCQRKDRPRACAVIAIMDAPHPDDLVAWRDQLFSNLPPEARAEAQSESRSVTMELSNETEYIVEPEGIIPHSLTVTKAGKISGPRNGNLETEQIIWEFRSDFDY